MPRKGSGKNSYVAGDYLTEREARATLAVTMDDLRDVAAVLKKRGDGKALKRDLNRGLRAGMKPTHQAVRSAALALPSKGRGTKPALRSAIAMSVLPVATTTTKYARVGIRARRTPKVRGFHNAPKRFNREKGWRHPVFGDRETWVQQRGKPGWFDDTIAEHKQNMINAVNKAFKAWAANFPRG